MIDPPSDPTPNRQPLATGPAITDLARRIDLVDQRVVAVREDLHHLAAARRSEVRLGFDEVGATVDDQAIRIRTAQAESTNRLRRLIIASTIATIAAFAVTALAVIVSVVGWP
ncbi:MAG: hypothetical protein AAF467_28010 [Actinomycetota bacterium]